MSMFFLLSLFKIASHSSIFSIVSSCSFLNASISSPINFCSCIFKIASACASVNRNLLNCDLVLCFLKVIFAVFPFTRQSFASATVLDPRITSIIKSMQSHALIKPSSNSCFSFNLISNAEYFLVISSFWYSYQVFRIIGSVNRYGRPLWIANIFTPNVSSNFVFLYKMLTIRSKSYPGFKSITIRNPSLLDWLEISVTSGRVLFSIRSMTSWINFPIPIPIIVYGISETISLSCSRFVFPFSNSIFPRILIFPVPVS